MTPLRPDWLTARPIAHRGLHDAAAGRVENSLSAARAAIDAGCAIECDVQMSSDGEAMVFHDFTLDRLTQARGRVDAMTAADLARLALKDGPDRIPTLSDLLMAIDGRVPLIVEVKSRFDGDARLTRRTCEIMRQHGGPVALKSFDPAVLIAARPLCAGAPLGIVAMNGYDYPDYAALAPDRKHALANLLHFGETRPDFLSWRVRDLPTAAAYLCRAALRLPVMAWTVRNAMERARAAAHADQMVFEGFRP